MLDEPNSYGITWTQDRILSVLKDTFGPDTRFFEDYGSPVFSDPAIARGQPRRSFGELDAGGFWLDHAVPLNGEYSDLTARFEFLPRENGLSVILQDLHVL